MRHRIYINDTLVAECNTTMVFAMFNKYLNPSYIYFIGKEIPYLSVGYMGELKYVAG